MTESTNIATTRVMDSLKTLFKNEYPKLSIFHDMAYLIHGAQWLNIKMPKVTHSDHRTASRVIQYEVVIDHFIYIGGKFKYEKHFTDLSTITEQSQQMLENNSNYHPLGVEKYFDGTVQSVDYDQVPLIEDIENWKDIIYSRIIFTCLVEFNNTD